MKQNNTIIRSAQNASFIVILAAGLSTVGIGLDSTDGSINPASLLFVLWAVSPYIYLWGLANASQTPVTALGVAVASVLTALFGLESLINAMYLNLDAQSGLVFVFVPFRQWVALVLMTLPFFLLNRRPGK